MNAIVSAARAAGVVGIVRCVFFTPLLVAPGSASPPKPKPRARDLGIPFDGAPGPLNLVTDVEGNSSRSGQQAVSTTQRLKGDRIDALFLATIQATEEALDNALVAGETMTGADYWRSYAIPHDQLRKFLRDHNRFVDRGAN